MIGFQWDNERSDIQLARDKAESQARENRLKGQARSMDLPIAVYGGSDAMHITEIVKKMIEENSMRSLWHKQQVFWDVEDIHDAVDDACVYLAIDNDFCPGISDKGDEIEITLQ